MNSYLHVQTVEPPDAFQPSTEITIVTNLGCKLQALFDSPAAMRDAARVLLDAATEADARWADLMTKHFAQARDFDDRRDDYEWPEGEVA